MDSWSADREMGDLVYTVSWGFVTRNSILGKVKSKVEVVTARNHSTLHSPLHCHVENVQRVHRLTTPEGKLR